MKGDSDVRETMNGLLTYRQNEGKCSRTLEETTPNFSSTSADLLHVPRFWSDEGLLFLDAPWTFFFLFLPTHFLLLRMPPHLPSPLLTYPNTGHPPGSHSIVPFSSKPLLITRVPPSHDLLALWALVIFTSHVAITQVSSNDVNFAMLCCNLKKVMVSWEQLALLESKERNWNPIQLPPPYLISQLLLQFVHPWSWFFLDSFEYEKR